MELYLTVACIEYSYYPKPKQSSKDSTLPMKITLLREEERMCRLGAWGRQAPLPPMFMNFYKISHAAGDQV